MFGRDFLTALLIFLTAFILRAYNANEHFLFTIDEEYILNQAQTIVQDFHLIWIGISVSVGFYLGPFVTYLAAFIIKLFGNDPIIFGYFSSALGSLVAVVIYLLGLKIFNRNSALVAAILYATLPIIVFYDQRFWNDSFIPILSLLMFCALVLSFKDRRWWVLFFISFGFVFHTHLSIVYYLFIAGYALWLQRKNFSWKILSLSIVIFLIIYSPLIVFDFNHNFSNVTAPLRAFSEGSTASSGIDFKKHSLVIFDFLGRYWYLNSGTLRTDEVHWGCNILSTNDIEKRVAEVSTRTNSHWLVSGISLFLILVFWISKNRWRDIKTRILILITITAFGLFLIFPGGALEYYLLGVFPLLVFIPGLVFLNSKRFLMIGFLGLITLISLNIYTIVTSSNGLGLSNQKEIVFKVREHIKDRSYDISEEGGCRKYSGWRYIFTNLWKAPNKASIDPTFSWLYPNQVKQNDGDYLVIVNEKRFNKLSEFENSIKFESGGFEAVVIKRDK